MATLRGLDSSDLGRFLEPVPTSGLRRLLRAAPRQMQRQLLRGFRIDTLPRDRAIRVVHEALRGPYAISIAHGVLEQWQLAVPAASELAQGVLGRDDLFDGRLPSGFLGRLSDALGTEVASVLMRFATGGEAATAGTAAKPAGLPPVQPSPGIAPAAASVAVIHRVFSSGLDRDLWLEEFGPDPIIENAQPVPKGVGSTEGAGIAESRALAAEKAGHWFTAATYWSTIAGSDERAADSFVRCHLRAIGLTLDQSQAPDHALEALLDSPAIPTVQDACRVIIRALVDDVSVQDRFLTRRAREAVARRAAELFPKQRRLLDARGVQPPLVRLAGDYSERLGQLTASSGGFFADRTLEGLAKKRAAIMEAIARLEPYLLNVEAPIVQRLSTFLGGPLTAYMNAEAGQDEQAFQVLSGLVDEYKAAKTGDDPQLTRLLIDPILSGAWKALEDHYAGDVHARLPALRVLVRKPAFVTNDEWRFEMEVRNDGRGTAREVHLQIHPGQRASNVLVDPQTIVLPALRVGDAEIREINAVAPADAQALELKLSINYLDRAGNHSETDAVKVIRRRDLDWKGLELLTPYSMLSINDPERLKGRADALRALRQGYRAKASFTITGQRRVGKTSLAKVFLNELRADSSAVPVHIPLGEIAAASGDGDLGRLGRDVVDRIVEEYRVVTGDEAPPSPALSEFRDSFNAAFSGYFRSLNRRRPVRLVIALDDFDELPTAMFTGDLGRRFFLALRAIIDGGATFLFVGSERLPAIMMEQAQRMNQVRSLPVDYLSTEALRQLVVEPTSAMIDFGDDAVQAIEAWSGGNPYFATLICITIWEHALAGQDAAIGELDVVRAAEEIASGGLSSHFQHFWADSPAADDEARDFAESKASAVLGVLVNTQSDPTAYVRRSGISKATALMTTAEADEQIAALLMRGVLEQSRNDPELIRIRVPIFAAWLKRHLDALRRTHLPARVSNVTNDLGADEVIAVASRLNYKGRNIGTDEVRSWLAQFGAIDDQRLMLKLLAAVAERGIYDLASYFGALRELDSLVTRLASERGYAGIKDAGNRTQNRFVTHVDAPGKSGSVAVKAYRSHNKIYERNAGPPERIVASIAATSGPAVLVCVNDFIGSGKSAADGINNTLIPLLDQHIADWRDRVFVCSAAIVGFGTGSDLIRAQIPDEIETVVANVLDESDRAFSPSGHIFDSLEERERAKELASRFGAHLEKKHPLGWEDSQALIVFYDTVPNNTLPILYKEGTIPSGTWTPLFPR